MKQLLTIILFLIAGNTFAQMHFSIPVQELDSVAALDSSTWHFHPIQLDVAVNQSQNSFAYYSITAATTFYEDYSKNPYYKAKNTVTAAELELPKSVFNLESAINADKSYNIAKLNPILAMFQLKYRQ